MRIRTVKSRQGFSLVELLLTLVLILCLAAASVFTFTALYRSANLDEGYDRFQSLIRFAQAEASTTGRKVRLQFVPSSGPSEERSDLRKIEVTWEADGLNAPGVFQTYTNKSWSEEMVNELVAVTKVQAIQSPNAAPRSAPAPAQYGPASEEGLDSAEHPFVTFYPDGSCDPAEIVLASRNQDDGRRVEVRLSGMLGSVTSRTLTSEESLAADEADAEQEFNDLFESSEPLHFAADTADGLDF